MSLVFKVDETANEDIKAGYFTDSEIMVMLGENGNSTLIRMHAGRFKLDVVEVPVLCPL